MSENKDKVKKSKRTPIIVALVAGVSVAVLVGIVINTTIPRNTFALDVVHPPKSVTVTIPAGASLPDGNATFNPKEATVVLGVNNTVVWVNENINPERLIGEDENMPGGFGKMKSLIEPNGGTFAFTFTEEGMYNYFSDIHPWLRGTVTVKKIESSLSQLVNSLSPIYPQVTVLKEKIDAVEGVALTQVGKTTRSESIERTPEGYGKPIYNDGQAELILSHGITSDGQDIVAATVTNTGTSKIYVASLIIGGATSSGIGTLSAYAIDHGYSPAVWGNIQKPSITEPVALNPGESITAHISGKWNVAAAANEPITTFSVGAGYTYDTTITEYKEGNNWSISITNFELP
ncbi:MAG: cupredoxin domain-containing protein [Nitrososphaerales archaeon]